jgi:hypothetical protein
MLFGSVCLVHHSEFSLELSRLFSKILSCFFGSVLHVCNGKLRLGFM